MGHWTTYRRRGTTPSATDVLPLPETPEITLTTNISSETDVNGNTGGTAQLWYGAPEFGSYTSTPPVRWTEVIDFGPKVSYVGYWVKTLNIGDGYHRSNQSPFSPAVYIAP